MIRDRGIQEGRADNAGYGVIGGIEQIDIEVVRENFETNFSRWR
jgi:hypothetical protein